MSSTDILDRTTVRHGGREAPLNSPDGRDIIAGLVSQVAGSMPASGGIRFDEQVAALGSRLMDEHPGAFDHLHQWHVVYVIDPNPPKKGCKAIARAVLAPALWHDLYGPDVVIAVSETWWQGADERQRSGGLYHALAHIWTAEDEAGEAVGVRLASHDVEAFLGEVAHFGDWQASIGELAEQLTIFFDSVAR